MLNVLESTPRCTRSVTSSITTSITESLGLADGWCSPLAGVMTGIKAIGMGRGPVTAAPKQPARYWRRHLNTMFALMPCVAASFDIDTFGVQANTANCRLKSIG